MLALGGFFMVLGGERIAVVAVLFVLAADGGLEGRDGRRICSVVMTPWGAGAWPMMSSNWRALASSIIDSGAWPAI